MGSLYDANTAVETFFFNRDLRKHFSGLMKQAFQEVEDPGEGGVQCPEEARYEANNNLKKCATDAELLSVKPEVEDRAVHTRLFMEKALTQVSTEQLL
ncbi:unnamed protein product [Enterobius vermicularis]|uniref:Ferritin n=1 Tax=Enterobius vermicularis TaxID=51028 RepID=A0A0N4UUI0_ENTVE|nr:unnamed protein product [Enterobius vermicularis]